MIDPEHFLTPKGNYGHCTCGWEGLATDIHAQQHGMCGECWGSGASPYWLDGGQSFCKACGGDGSSVTQQQRELLISQLEQQLEGQPDAT